jgi:hypothetical protein
MSTPINQEIRELRMAREHYVSVLNQDKIFKNNDNPNNCKLLTDEDINKINRKINAIDVKINELLQVERDYIN